ALGVIMRTSTRLAKSRNVLIITAMTVLALSALTMLGRARTATSTITIVNSSSRNVSHVYLSPPNTNNWSNDQLNNSAITPNHSATVSCGQASIKVIAEDQDGCFIYQVVDCSSDVAWTITNEATRDCGN